VESILTAGVLRPIAPIYVMVCNGQLLSGNSETLAWHDICTRSTPRRKSPRQRPWGYIHRGSSW